MYSQLSSGNGSKAQHSNAHALHSAHLDSSNDAEKALQQHGASTLLGMSIAIVANVVISVALNFQKVEGQRCRQQGIPYTQSRRWWSAFALMVFGELGNFTAYAFAPAALVAPLGAVSVVSNSILASFISGERFRPRDFLGTLFVCAGGFMLVWFAPTKEQELDVELLEQYLLSWVFLVYAGIVMLFFIALHLWQRNQEEASSSVVVDLLLVAIVGSVTVMATKGVATSVRLTIQGRENAFSSWIMYGMIVVLVLTVVVQVRGINRALVKYGTSQTLPVYYVLFTLASLLGSIILYREFDALFVGSQLGFFTGCFLTFFGVYLITSDRPVSSDEFDDEESQTVLAGVTLTPEAQSKLHDVMLGGGIGLGLGLVLTPVCFPLFLCCSTMLGAGAGAWAAEVRVVDEDVARRDQPVVYSTMWR